MIYRHELKYLLNKYDAESLKSKLSVIMDVDLNSNTNGYSVSSLYFDTINNRFYDENDAGVESRNKIRIRKYNEDNSSLKLEIKSKKNSLCFKESQKINEDIAKRLTNLPYTNFTGSSNNTLGKVLLANSMYCLKPVVIVNYNRYALVYNTGNVRITLDANITGDIYTNNFLDNINSGINIIDDDHYILEVKYDDILPSYITNILDEFKLNQMAYSKYYLCRRALGI